MRPSVLFDQRVKVKQVNVEIMETEYFYFRGVAQIESIVLSTTTLSWYLLYS